MKQIKQIDLDYYEWLIEQIHIPNGKSYRGLFEVMHNTAFHWTIPNDDNRVQDGKDLRYYFLDGRKGQIELGEATLLEILVSLSQKVAFTAGGNPKRWAWKLLKNLRLTHKADPLNQEDLERINDVLDALVWRTYQYNGRGGFFPLENPKEDQRKVEIWYQMNAYVIEKTAP
jgi:hypothetical protein